MSITVIAVFLILFLFSRLIWIRENKVGKVFERSYFSTELNWYMLCLFTIIISIPLLFFPYVALTVLSLGTAVDLLILTFPKTQFIKKNIHKAESYHKKRDYKKALEHLHKVYQQHPSENVKKDLTMVEYDSGTYLFGKWMFIGSLRNGLRYSHPSYLSENGFNNMIISFNKEILMVLLSNKRGNQKTFYFTYRLDGNQIYIFQGKHIRLATYFMEVRTLRINYDGSAGEDFYKRIV